MATKILSVSLDAHYSAFAERKIIDGDFKSPDDVVRAGMRLLEAQGEQLARLRAALVEGEQSGPAQPYNFATIKARIHARHATDQ